MMVRFFYFDTVALCKTKTKALENLEKASLENLENLHLKICTKELVPASPAAQPGTARTARPRPAAPGRFVRSYLEEH